MHIKFLYCHNFRIFSEVALEFHSHINEIVGDNAQGKTSILEALYLCMTTTSFRTSFLRQAVRQGKEGFFIEVRFEKFGVEHELKFSYDGVKKRILFDREPCSSASFVIGQLLGVICSPEVENLVKGAPQGRRHFLDLQIAQVDPLYVHHLSRYARALKQRNFLLRQKDEKMLFPFEQELALSGAYIVKRREYVVSKLQVTAKEYFNKLTSFENDTSFSLGLTAHIPEGLSEEDLRLHYEKEYKRKRSQEIFSGTTLVGPHRDDLTLFTEKGEFRHFASEGELKIASLALKLAEWQFLKDTSSEYPIMMIDDVKAFLDEKRSELLFNVCSELQAQVFFSSHTPIYLTKEKKEKRVVTLHQGKVVA